MTRALVIVAVAIAAAACADSSPTVDHATLAGIDYDVPAGWRSLDQSGHETKIVVWTPADNVRRESVTVMRTRAMPEAIKAGPAHVERFLAHTQRKLPHGKFGHATRFTTKRGLVGVRIDGEFVPAGAKVPYRRVHAVVFDGKSASLTHVLYTARTPDLDAFEIVLDSLLHRKEA